MFQRNLYHLAYILNELVIICLTVNNFILLALTKIFPFINLKWQIYLCLSNSTKKKKIQYCLDCIKSCVQNPKKITVSTHMVILPRCSIKGNLQGIEKGPLNNMKKSIIKMSLTIAKNSRNADSWKLQYKKTTLKDL